MRLFLILFLVLLSFSFVGEEGNLINNYRILDANNIETYYKNNGIFNHNFQNGQSGFEWPAGSDIYARQTSGIWIGTIANNDTLAAHIGYGSSNFIPGFVDENGLPQGQSDSAYRIYKITRGDSTNQDYLNWPAYQGAYISEFGKPFNLGTQTMFFVNNDAYHPWSGDSTLKAQVLNTVWAYSNNTLLRNVIFMEYRIINRSNKIWNNTYVGIFTDDDLGSYADDNIGVDSNRGLGFTYNYDNYDENYGDNPPAVGFTFVRGPYDYTGNISDTIKYYDPPGSSNLRIKIGYKRRSISSFQYFNEGGPEPDFPYTAAQVYRVLFGLWRNGQQWISPVTGQPTKLPYSGDPVTGTGWVSNYDSDMRSLQNIGPFNMNPGDTQSIIVAQVIARGSSNLNSITKLRETADYARQIYEENFQSVLSVNSSSIEIPDGFKLDQNYPNPFNPVTNLEFGISKLGFVSLKVYDILGKEISTLVNENLNPGTYKYNFDASDLTSGIYFYRLQVGKFSETRRMILLK